MVQYKATLVIIGALKGTSCDKLYQELGLETLTDRRWSCRLFFFHKFIQGFLLSYLQITIMLLVKEQFAQQQK